MTAQHIVTIHLPLLILTVPKASAATCTDHNTEPNASAAMCGEHSIRACSICRLDPLLRKHTKQLYYLSKLTSLPCSSFPRFVARSVSMMMSKLSVSCCCSVTCVHLAVSTQRSVRTTQVTLTGQVQPLHFCEKSQPLTPAATSIPSSRFH